MPVANGQIEIDYVSENFPRGSRIADGHAILTTSWDEILWAALTVGRPNRYYVFRHGDASMFEAIFRLSLIHMALEQHGPHPYRLRRTAAASTLDPSEKGAVNYFLGLAFCKLFSAKLLQAPWVMHLDVFRQRLDLVLRGRSRPDLVGPILLSTDWVVLESKGRAFAPNTVAKRDAKRQAQRVIRVYGRPPRFRVGAITYFQNDILQFFWRDPETDKYQNQEPIEIIPDKETWRYYYQPIYSLFRQRLPISEGISPFSLLQIEEADVQVGIHPAINSYLAREQWEEAKDWCNINFEELRSEGYQADGLRIIAGKTWHSSSSEIL